MKESRMSILLHPVRMRILQTLIGDKKLTAQQIGEYLPEIPPATLYRHLNKLAEAELIAVFKENQIRGTVEKVYRIAEESGPRTGEEFLNASREDHLKYFFTFLIHVLGDFERYISQESIDMVRDGVGYSQAQFYASDEEFKEFGMELGAAIMKLAGNKPSPERKLRALTTIVLPQDNSKTGPGTNAAEEGERTK